MSRSLQLHDDADLELNEAADYYDIESPGLGGVFLDDVDKGFARILERPDAATEVAPGVRKLVLAKFPFTVIYAVCTDVIRVLAIAHQRKRPYYWRDRS
jgi:toxin ParE1/3/4